jgi:Flp pilus assembly pilin Flp
MLRDEDGQDLIEYALIAGLISVACVLALTSVGNAINQNYESATTTFAAS